MKITRFFVFICIFLTNSQVWCQPGTKLVLEQMGGWSRSINQEDGCGSNLQIASIFGASSSFKAKELYIADGFDGVFISSYVDLNKPTYFDKCSCHKKKSEKFFKNPYLKSSALVTKSGGELHNGALDYAFGFKAKGFALDLGLTVPLRDQAFWGVGSGLEYRKQFYQYNSDSDLTMHVACAFRYLFPRNVRKTKTMDIALPGQPVKKMSYFLEEIDPGIDFDGIFGFQYRFKKLVCDFGYNIHIMGPYDFIVREDSSFLETTTFKSKTEVGHSIYASCGLVFKHFFCGIGLNYGLGEDRREFAFIKLGCSF